MLAALIPRPGRSLGDVMASEPDTTTEEFNALPRQVGKGGAVTWDPDIAGPFFYRTCNPDTARWAAAKLRTQVWTTSREPCPLEKWPDCEIASIICTGDELLTPDWSRRTAQDVLGVEPIELPGGHFPMLSIPTALRRWLQSRRARGPRTERIEPGLLLLSCQRSVGEVVSSWRGTGTACAAR